MMSKRGVKLVVVVSMLIVLLAISVGVQAGNPVPVGPTPIVGAPNGSGSAITASAADVAATNAAWASAEARAGAAAMPMAEVDLNVAPDGSAETFGPAGFSPAGPPDPQANAVARQMYPDAWQALEESGVMMDMGLEPAAADGTPGVYDYYLGNFYNAFWKNYPYYAVGILRFQNQANQNFYCTASVVSSRNVIATAAHCLYDTTNNQWYKNWKFYPAERNGVAPYGSFNWAAAQVLPAWIALAGGYNLNWVKHDVGLIRLFNDAAGRGVTFYVGWLGRSWNQSYIQVHHDIGYPSNLPNGTKYTYINVAESYQATTETLGQGSNFRNGASGSPWIRVFRPYESGAKNYVNSVYSGYSTTTPNTYGARFNNANIVWLCAQAIVLC